MEFTEITKSGIWEAGDNRASYIIVKTTYDGTNDVDYRLFGYTWNDVDSPNIDIEFVIRNKDELTPAQIYAGIQGATVDMVLSIGSGDEVSFPAELYGTFTTEEEASAAMDNLKMIEGCRDPLATNFNKSANIEGSCNYPDDKSLPWGIIMVIAVGFGLFALA